MKSVEHWGYRTMEVPKSQTCLGGVYLEGRIRAKSGWIEMG